VALQARLPKGFAAAVMPLGAQANSDGSEPNSRLKADLIEKGLRSQPRPDLVSLPPPLLNPCRGNADMRSWQAAVE